MTLTPLSDVTRLTSAFLFSTTVRQHRRKQDATFLLAKVG